ncbi:MAG: hypothetical protein QOJ11_1432 [Frankiales bacterium]|nr:hypothetical protein [Frankiales bacterium]
MRRLLLAAGVLALLTTGCGATAAPASSSFTLATAATGSPATLAKPCKASDEPPQDSPNNDYDGRLTAAFVPVAAYLCFDEQRTYPGDGVWQVLIGQHLVGDLGPLRAALEEPDTAAPASKAGVTYACAGSLAITPTLILVSSAGQQLRPRAPVDWCGDQRPDLGTAIAHLQRVDVQVTKLRQMQSQTRLNSIAAAVALGCQPSWKDPFTLGMVPPTLSPGGPFSPAPVTLVLCLYKANPADPPLVDFVAGKHLTATQTRQLLAAATLPGKPGGCSKPHSDLLLVSTGSTITAQIEVGGCSRAVRETGGRDTVGRVDAAVVAALMPR